MLTNGMFVHAQYSTNIMFTSTELTKVLFVFSEILERGALWDSKTGLKRREWRQT